MKNDKLFIVKLNPVDYLSLVGLLLSGSAIGLTLHKQFSFALSLLFLAMLADAFDGLMARKLGTEREFGRYLDGFIDVFDYLLAPALFLYIWGFNTWYYVLVLFLFLTCGVIRLSVFNLIGNVKNEEDELSYLGMPVFWSVLFLGIFYILGWIVSTSVLFPLIGVLFTAFAVLMILNRRFYKFRDWRVMLSLILGFSILFALKGLIGVLF